MDFKRETHIDSRQIGCCGARMWALVIGWIQTIGSAIGILIAIVSYAVVKEVVKQAAGKEDPDVSKEDKEKALELVHILATVLFVVTLIAIVIELGSGIILILGVKQQNAKKLKIWNVVQIIFLVFAVIGVVMSLFSADILDAVKDIIGVLITVFCIWVVNIHRQELVSAGAGSVNFGDPTA